MLLRYLIFELLPVSLVILSQQVELGDQKVIVFSYFEDLVLVLLYLLLSILDLLQIGQTYYFLGS